MRTFEVTLPDCETVFVCNRVSFRTFKQLIKLVEAIRTSGVSSKTNELIDEALALCVPNASEIEDLIDFTQSMQLIAEVVKGGKVSESERKKSE